MRLGLVIAVLIVLGRASEAGANVISVTTTDDEFGSGAGCSLREAIKAANSDAAFGGCPAGSGIDQVTLSAGTYTLTIAGAGEDNDATGDLDILQSLSIEGLSAVTTIVDGGGLDRVFDVTSGTTVSISGVTVQGGVAAGDVGGGIFSGATLTLANLVVTGNTADGGGGLALNGPSNTLSDCVVRGNTATTAGGGLEIRVGGSADVATSTVSGNDAPFGGGVLNLDTLVLRNSTVSGNTSSNEGAGVYNNGTLTLKNVTIAANSTPGGNTAGLFNNDANGTTTSQNSLFADNVSVTPADADCSGTLASAGHNLIETVGACTITGDLTGNVTGQDPVLGPLTDNGGPTATMDLLVGSPALDAGDPGVPGSGGTACEANDQRGGTRPLGTGCDIGAVEAVDGGGTTTTSTSSSTSTTTTSTSTSTTESTTSTTVTSTSTTESTTSTTVTTTSTTESTTSTTATTTSTTESTTSTTVEPTTTTTESTTSTSTTSTSSTTTSSSTTSTSTTTTSSSTTSTTLAPVCVNGTTISKGVISVTKIGAPAGNERITFKGTLDFQAGQPSTFDPPTTGAQVLIEDLATGSAMGAFDLTHLTTPIPPGGFGTGCSARDGWKKRAYRNVSNALSPPKCPAGSALGLTNLTFVDQRAKGKGLRFTVKARNAMMNLGNGPLRGTVVLGATSADSLAGRCGVVTFSPTRCKRKGATLTCK